MDTGTIENTDTAGRKAMIVTTDEAVDILNSYNFTIDPPTGVVHSVGADPEQHVNIQADAPGEALIDVTGSGAYAGLLGAITVTVTEGGGGGNPGGLTITLGPALPKL